jgi:hypothetical protein
VGHPILGDMQDQRGPYVERLTASSLPRSHWAGVSTENPSEHWFFESVEDQGELVAIRQLTVESDGRRHAYTAKHLDDEWGFLTGQPLRPAESEDLQPISAEAFQAAWGA